MKIKNFKPNRAFILLLTSTALLPISAVGAEYVVSTPTSVTNGNAANVVDGNDKLTVSHTGNISTIGFGDDAISASGNNNIIINHGTLSTTGEAAEGIFSSEDDVTNTGTITTTGLNSDGIEIQDNGSVDNSGSITTSGATAMGILAGSSTNITVSGSITTGGAGSRGISSGSTNTITNTGTITTNGTGAAGIEGNNNNTISNTGTVLTTGGSASHAIWLDDSNTLTNSGILRTQGADSSGIHAEDSNTITNSGTISTSAMSSEAILVMFTNTVFNSGTVITLGESSAGAYLYSNNIFTNTGSITTSGTDSTGVYSFYGNTINNSGTISTSGATARAIAAAEKIILNNSGTISTSGSSAIAVTNMTNTPGNEATINNTGTISTSGSAGLAIAFANDNKLTNSGLISTSGNSAAGVAFNSNNEIENSGTIRTSAAGAIGVLVQADNEITNSGSIETSGSSASALFINGNDNTITNSGVLKTAGDNADALRLVGANNIIGNSGEISALGTAAAAIYADAGSFGNIVTNSGKVTSAQSHAINLSGTDNQLILQAPAFIGGRIVLGPSANVDVVTGRSQSVLWDFSNHGAAFGFSATGPVPYAWNSTTSQFATLDPTALSASPDMLADVTDSLSGLTQNQNAQEWWLQGYGNFANYGAQGVFNDYQTLNAGIATGAAFAPTPDFSLGAFIGYQSSNLSVNSQWVTSQTISGNGIVAGLYSNIEMENLFMGLALYGGWSANSSERFVNDNLATLGTDYATANFNSWFLSPEISLGADIQTDGVWTLTPSATARFSSQWLDGYSETGSNANASVGARLVQVFEGELELAATRDIENGTLGLTAGIEYRQALGGSTQNVTLLGQTLAMPLDNAALFGAYVGVDASYNISNTSILNLAARAGVGGNNNFSLSGTVGFNSSF